MKNQFIFSELHTFLMLDVREMFDKCDELATNGSVLAMVGHFKKVSQTFAEMPNRITNVAFRTVCPTIANTMLAVVLLLL